MKNLLPLSFLIVLFIGKVRAQDQLETIIQKGHELAVTCVAISPDSNYVATGSKDKSVKLWEVATGREVRSFLGHDRTVNNIAFSSDGKTILSGSQDKTVKLWNIMTGREIFTVTSEDFITDVAIDPKSRFFVAVGYNLNTADSATIYDLKSQKIIKRLPTNAEKGRGKGVTVSISADGQWLAIGEDNHIAKIYNTSTWTLVHTFVQTEGWCGGCIAYTDFSTDNKFIYMLSHGGKLKKYDLANGLIIKVYEDNVDNASGLAVSADGKTLARSTEKDIKVYDENTGNLIATRNAEEKGEFNRITFSPDGKRLFVSSDNNTAFLWNYRTNKIETIFTGFLNARDQGGLDYDPNFYWQSAIAKYVRFKNNMLISNDGKTLIKGKFGKKVKQWNIANGKTVMEFAGHHKAVLCYALSADGKKMVTGGGDGKIILWDVTTGDSLKVITTYREPIFDIHFNNEETEVLSSSWDATLKIHDLKTGRLITYLDFESYSAYNIGYDVTNLYFFTARLDNSLQMWERDTRSVVRSFIGHTDIVSSMRTSSNGAQLLTSSWDGSVRLWDVSTGLMVKKFRHHQGQVYTAIFSPDEKSIYSAGADRTIKKYDISTGNILATYEGHQAEITTLLFSPDNKMLISHSVDGVTKFWDLPSGNEFFEHIHFGENDWMVKNREGYFHGTDNARKYIHFVSGIKTFAVDQFFDDFYRPDLLPTIFQNRGKANDLKGVQGKLKNSPPPTVKVAVVAAGEGKAEVFVRMIDNGAGVDNLKIFHNGKSMALQDLKFPKGKEQTSTYKHTVMLVGGQNVFTAIAKNKDNVESDAASAEIFSDHPTKSSICHVLAVGINKYKNPKLTLNYAKPDAESFLKLVDERGASLFKAIELHTLYDEDATRAQILRKLDEVAQKINPEDVFIFYYAGHGSMVDNQFYFIPTESSRLYDASALNKEAIEASILQEKFKHIKALKQLIIMDACQSGGSVELLATRGASEEKAIAQLSRSAGIHVMASAGSEQFATEFSALGHGLFTYVLIRALQGEADGAPKDGKVTIYELKSYIDDQVPEMTRKMRGKPQYPYTFSRGQDFPVSIER